MWSIRSFLNTDTPALSKLWTLHYASIDSPSICPVSVWDVCILSKPYFRADELALAVDSLQNPVGFIHFGFVGDRGLQSLSQDHAAIHQLCVLPGPDEDKIAEQLLTYAEITLRKRGAISCSGIGGAERSGFYLGIGEGDNMMGVLANDPKSQRWLARGGFSPIRPTECWELELSRFRPPMDRLQIQVRRSCTIGRILEEDYQHWWTSVVLGHCEQARFHLMLKQPPSLGGELMYWSTEPGIASLDSSVVRLVLTDHLATEEGREQFVYLVSESLRQLQQERKRLVRAVVSADQQRSVSLLHRLGFRSVDHGLLFEKAYQTGESAWSRLEA